MEDFSILSWVIFGYLVIPASSSEPERLFSHTKDLINIRRNRMKERLIKLCVFLHQNFKYNTLDIPEMLKMFKRTKVKVILANKNNKKTNNKT